MKHKKYKAHVQTLQAYLVHTGDAAAAVARPKAPRAPSYLLHLGRRQGAISCSVEFLQRGEHDAPAPCFHSLRISQATGTDVITAVCSSADSMLSEREPSCVRHSMVADPVKLLQRDIHSMPAQVCSFIAAHGNSLAEAHPCHMPKASHHGGMLVFHSLDGQKLHPLRHPRSGWCSLQ